MICSGVVECFFIMTIIKLREKYFKIKYVFVILWLVRIILRLCDDKKYNM